MIIVLAAELNKFSFENCPIFSIDFFLIQSFIWAQFEIWAIDYD